MKQKKQESDEFKLKNQLKNQKNANELKNKRIDQRIVKPTRK